MLLFLFLLALTAVSPSDQQEMKLLRGGCPMFWYSFNNRCYRYMATHSTWGDAELHCVSQGANLVSIHSLEEDDFVKMLIRNFDHAEGQAWIGLSDAEKEGAWLWSDGSKITFTNWHTGEPNNYKGVEHCVHMNYGTAKKWNDVTCLTTYPFVCKSRTT